MRHSRPPLAFLAAFLALLCTIYNVTAQTLPQSTSVQVAAYSYANGILDGEILVRNLAFQKAVTVFYADGTGKWDDSYRIPAQYAAPVPNSRLEIWIFNSTKPFSEGVSSFYVKYTVNGKDYYDSQNGQNYPVTPTSPSSTTTTVDRTTTTTTQVKTNPSPTTTPTASAINIENFSFQNNVLSGSVVVRNLAFEKKVTVIFTTANDNNPQANRFSARWQSQIPGSNNAFERWVFDSSAFTSFPNGIVSFVVQFEVGGQTFVTERVNVPQPSPTPTTSQAATTTTATTTIE
ncbi:hypothetical protein HK102_005195, partial [Quaeritorhiza haematococci]